MCPQDSREEVNEGEPIHPPEVDDAPTLAPLRLVEHQRSMGSHDLGWHDEWQHGMVCPWCERYKLKRHRHTVYCHFCKYPWWSRRPV
jgi:hypothetical protein